MQFAVKHREVGTQPEKHGRSGNEVRHQRPEVVVGDGLHCRSQRSTGLCRRANASIVRERSCDRDFALRAIPHRAMWGDFKRAAPLPRREKNCLTAGEQPRECAAVRSTAGKAHSAREEKGDRHGLLTNDSRDFLNWPFATTPTTRRLGGPTRRIAGAMPRLCPISGAVHRSRIPEYFPMRSRSRTRDVADW